DPLTIFATGPAASVTAATTGAIYGAEVGSEISLKSNVFPSRALSLPTAGTLSTDEVEETVRTNGSVLTDGSAQVAALYYIDPRRFDADDDGLDFNSGVSARVVEQNMSVSTPQLGVQNTPEYADDVIPVRQASSIYDAFYNAGYSEE